MSIQWLFDVIEDRKKNPTEKSYTSSLFRDGLPRIAQKVGEEGTEVVVAALSQSDERLIEEVADLTYHTLVLLSARGIKPEDVLAELEKRHLGIAGKCHSERLKGAKNLIRNHNSI